MCKRSKNPKLIHCLVCGRTTAEREDEPGVFRIHCKHCNAPLRVRIDKDLNVHVEVLPEAKKGSK